MALLTHLWGLLDIRRAEQMRGNMRCGPGNSGEEKNRPEFSTDWLRSKDSGREIIMCHLSKWLVNAFKRRMDGEVDQGRSKLTRCSTFICVALRPQRKRNVDVARETGNLKNLEAASGPRKKRSK